MARAIAALLSAVIASLVPSALAADAVTGFKVVVNASNPTSALSREELARLFLKKSTSWPGGKAAVPIDQPTSAEARQAFSKGILREGTNDVAAYWNRVIFSGRGTPPSSKPSDAEVIAFVRSNPGAVGYVAANASLGDGVKLLTIQD
jgi:ABC-type phosphate transport system substrate-binding protein